MTFFVVNGRCCSKKIVIRVYRRKKSLEILFVALCKLNGAGFKAQSICA